MARVKRLQVNDLGEVTGAIVQKGSSGECVKRYSSTFIPLLRMKDDTTVSDAVADVPEGDAVEISPQIPSSPLRVTPQRTVH